MPRRPSLAPILATILALCLAFGPSAAFAGRALTVFAAASLKTALDEIAAGWPGGALRISYGGSSALARQILQGAPADLFVAASPEWMDALAAEGMIAGDSRIDLLTNTLVLVAAPGVAASPAPGPELVAALGDDRLALALVDAVPAGIYARQALEALGAWEALAPRAAQADNVRAALRLVALGEAPFGIVYATDAAAEPAVRVVAAIDPALHDPIRYPAAIVAGQDDADARALLAWLAGDAARAVFAAHGFGTPR